MPEDLRTRVTILEAHEKYQDEKIEKNSNGIARIWVLVGSVGLAACGVIAKLLLNNVGVNF